MNILTSWIFRQNTPIPPVAPPIFMSKYIQGSHEVAISYFAPFGVPGIFLERSIDGIVWELIAAVPRDDSGMYGPPGTCYYTDSTCETDVEYFYRAQSYSGPSRSIYVNAPGSVYTSRTSPGMTVYVNDSDPTSAIVEFTESMQQGSGNLATQYTIFGRSVTSIGWIDDTHLALVLDVPIVGGDIICDLEYTAVVGNDIRYANGGTYDQVRLAPFVARVSNDMVWAAPGGEYTIGSGGDYANLKEAFDAVNAGTLTGDLVFQVISSSVSPSPALLNCNGEGAANYDSILVYPTVQSASLSCATPGVPAIVLGDNGTPLEFVTIDGRVNRSGFSNMYLQTSNGISAVAMKQAQNCTIAHCIAVALQYTATVVSVEAIGPNVNIINNEINTAGGSALIGLSVTSNGVGNATVACNRITGVFSPITHVEFTTYGIYSVGDGASTLYGNSIYSNGPISSTYSSRFIGIAGLGTQTTAIQRIQKNYIGGTEPYCGGAFPLSNSAVQGGPTPTRNSFIGIKVDNTSNNATVVEYNTIKNIEWDLFSDPDGMQPIPLFAGIEFGEFINNGEETRCQYNTIGDLYNRGYSIKVIGRAAEDSFVKGIYSRIFPDGVQTLYNTIGSIQISTGNLLYSTHFAGIDLTSGSSYASAQYNTIGGVLEDSIRYIAASPGASMIGISLVAFSTTTGSNNTVRNMLNLSTSAVDGTCVIGIKARKGSTNSNTIFNLKGWSSSANSTTAPSVAGIVRVATTSEPSTANSNTIYSLSNMRTTGANNVIGIWVEGRTAALPPNNVSTNFIQSLYGYSSGSTVFGIKTGVGSFRISNNILQLGSSIPAAIYGIYDLGNGANNTRHIAFNTISVTGTGVGSARSACLYSNAGTNTWIYKSNLLLNSRSTLAGSNLHYALYLDSPTNAGTADWNNLIASGTGGMLASYNGTNYNALPVGGPGTGHDNDTSIAVAFRTTLTGANAYRLLTANIPGNNATVNIYSDFAAEQRTAFNMGAFENQMLPIASARTNPVNLTRIDVSWETQDPAADSEIIERSIYGSGVWAQVGTFPTGVGITTFSDNTAIATDIYEYRFKDVDSGGLTGGYTRGSIASIGGTPNFVTGFAGRAEDNLQDMTCLFVAADPQFWSTITPPVINTAWLSMPGKTIVPGSARYSGGNIYFNVTVPFAEGDEIPDVTYTQPAPGQGIQYNSFGWSATCIFEAYIGSFVAPLMNFYPVVSAVVENAAPSDIVITLGAALDETPVNIPVPGDNHCFVRVDGNMQTITTIAVSGAVVTLTLDTPVAAGQAVTSSYQFNSVLGDLLYLVSGRSVPSWSDFNVTNNVL